MEQTPLGWVVVEVLTVREAWDEKPDGFGPEKTPLELVISCCIHKIFDDLLVKVWQSLGLRPWLVVLWDF